MSKNGSYYTLDRTLRATNFVLRIWRQKTSGWLVEVATWHAATINNPLKAPVTHLN